jgi:hypothetical protein
MGAWLREPGQRRGMVGYTTANRISALASTPEELVEPVNPHSENWGSKDR